MEWNHKKIEAKLKRLEWGKARLAFEMGLPRQAIYQYFKRKVTIYKAQRVADALGLSVKDLLI